MAKSTKKAYIRNWNYFYNFLENITQQVPVLPVHTQHVALFIAHLYNQNLRSSTIKSYISTISFVHKIGNLEDPTKTFLIKKAIIGQKRKESKPSYKLPITRNILHKLVQAVPFASDSSYDQVIFKAIFLFTFYACLRIGEVVEAQEKMHTLQIHQISPINTKQGQGYKVKFSSYKHSYNLTPTFHLQPTNSKYCPVNALSSFLAMRPKVQGPLFIFKNKKPVSRQNVSLFLKTCLKLQGFNDKYYSTHSFRIGRATQLAKENIHDNIIKSTGRWKSQAFQGYVRPSHFVLPI